MRRWPALQRAEGSIAPVFLVVIAFLLIMGWVLAGTTAAHYQQAAAHAQGILAEELARAGVEAAVAIIDQRAVPPATLSGTEATGSYEVSIRPTGAGTYLVESVGRSRRAQRGVRAEVAPPPESFALLAGGDVTVDHFTVALTGGETAIVGDINAHGDVSLRTHSALVTLLPAILRLRGDIRAGGSASLAAETGIRTDAVVKVEGGIAANRDVRLKADAGLLGTAWVEVSGPVAYGGELRREEGGLGMASIDTRGALVPGGGAALPTLASHGVDFYEALVADLEERGALRTLSPEDACDAPIATHTRVTGSLSRLNCWTMLRVENGAVVVIDGSLDVPAVRAEGLVYVRGGSTPNPNGHVDVGTLSLLEVLHSLDPAAGQGALVATGNITVKSVRLLDLLTFGPEYGTVLQLLALSTGPTDSHNDLTVGLGGLAEALGGGRAAPLFLYTAGQGDINIYNNMLAGALAFPTYPLVAVAGGDLTVTDGSLADVVSSLTIEASPEIWEQVPSFLQGLGRARVITWEWMDP